jgi:penicillin G amidase
MKIVKRIAVVLLALILIACASVYFWLLSSKPAYEGTLTLHGLKEEVQVHYDTFGVPSIQASNKHDLYLAFGYRHAAERLFQMEMLRRAGSGRLAEIIGQPLIKVDKLFRTLGIPMYAKQSAAYFETLQGQPIYEDVQAYLAGINQYIAEGNMPPEFGLIGITPQPFTVEDMYCTLGAMSFSFSQGQKSEFIVDYISEHFGASHLKDLGLYHGAHESFIRSNQDGIQERPAPFQIQEVHSSNVDIAAHSALSAIAQVLPMAPLEGSNAWVLSGKKTKNGHVIFCNDTHIGYMLPQTWYEAHLTCPGFEMYGHFMAGIPFAMVGRNSHLSWGLTMLLNDDVDFYREEVQQNKVHFKDQWQEVLVSHETIRVKGEADTLIEIRHTSHGPIINEALNLKESAGPISMFWTYTHCDNRNLDALYHMNTANDMVSFEKGLSLIHAPGLNVNYGDAAGNVAWWACAKLIQRPAHVNSFTVLDGRTGMDDPLGFYDFSENPKNINPTEGYIYSANDWPQPMQINQGDSTVALWYPGYYKPQYRADRIVQLIETQNQWDLESIQSVMNDCTNPMDAKVLQEWLKVLQKNAHGWETENQKYLSLFDWNGQYEPSLAQPTFFSGMLYHVLHSALADELGEDRFKLFLETHQIQRAYGQLMFNDTSAWWDIQGTTAVESRAAIFEQAYAKTFHQLSEKWGSDPTKWTWNRSSSIEIKHPLGEVALLRPIFNLGPSPVHGGNESIRQAGFYMDSTLENKVFFGSQMRIIVDFLHPDSALNITPAGQSGHVLSPHYDDQFEMYLAGKFRVMRFQRANVEGTLLRLIPG